MKILGVMDEDPFSDLTWSGSSKYFFEELEAAGILSHAVSAEPASLERKLIQLKNFQPDMSKWRFKYHLDTTLYKRMTVAAHKAINSDYDYDVILQVGAWYDMTAVEDKLHVSYHDGNLATLLKSPYGYPDISPSFIDKALAHERDLYSRLDLIFPMSEWLRESFIKDFDVPESKVVAVGAGINLPYIRNTENKDYSQKNLLMIGKAFERKGGVVVLEAFKKVLSVYPEARLTVIGPDDIGEHENVNNIGYIDKRSPEGIERLLNAYSENTVFIMPSLYEPFGIVFAEAMAHRLPCIGANNCAMPEIIDDGETGFVVEAGNDAELADRIITLLQSPELCKEMGNRGYEKYLSTYNWSSVVDKIKAAIGEKL